MKKTIAFIAACIGALAVTAGIGLPSASGDPTDAPGPNPTVANQPPNLGGRSDRPNFPLKIVGPDDSADIAVVKPPYCPPGSQTCSNGLPGSG